MTYQEIDDKIKLIDKFQDEFDDYLTIVLDHFFNELDNKSIEQLEELKNEIHNLVDKIHPRIAYYSIIKTSLFYSINTRIKLLQK